IGAVLIAGARAPVLVTRALVERMKPGAVIVDVAVDQGGCIATIHPTTLLEPIYQVADVVHYGVANMPALVPRTSTFALANATVPYAVELADRGAAAAVRGNPELARGVNVWRGRIVHPGVAAALGASPTPLDSCLGRGDKVEIRGFGSFKIRQRRARVGRNPKTGASVSVPGKKVPFFKVGKGLRELVNA